MHNRLKLKIIIPLCLFVIILMIVIFLLMQEPKKVMVTTVKTPYSTLSDVNETDSLIIKLYINQTNCYYNDFEKITACSITSDDNLYKLKLNSINYGNEETTLHNQKYYLFLYNFSYDFKFLSEYQDYLDKAYLNLEFSNGIRSSIEIGSLTIIKYVDEDTNQISDIAITQSKTITSLKDHDNNFYGISIGIRNLNLEKQVKIKKIEVLDKSIKQIDNYKEVDNLTTDITLTYPNYPSINDFPSNILIDKKSIKFLVLPIVQDNNNDIDAGNFGLKVTYEVMENNDSIVKEYYFRKFTFYDYYYSVSEDDLMFYEYEFR